MCFFEEEKPKRRSSSRRRRNRSGSSGRHRAPRPANREPDHHATAEVPKRQKTQKSHRQVTMADSVAMFDPNAIKAALAGPSGPESTRQLPEEEEEERGRTRDRYERYHTRLGRERPLEPLAVSSWASTVGRSHSPGAVLTTPPRPVSAIVGRKYHFQEATRDIEGSSSSRANRQSMPAGAPTAHAPESIRPLYGGGHFVPPPASSVAYDDSGRRRPRPQSYTTQMGRNPWA